MARTGAYCGKARGRDLPNSGRIKIIEEGSLVLLFNAEDVSLRLASLEHIPQMQHGTADRLQGVIGQKASLKCVPPSQQDHTDLRPVLDRLTLTACNVCNLACSYCYASGGTYYNSGGLMMTATTAINAINKAVRAYSDIRHISFFGGEPTLNIELIEIVCEFVLFLRRKRILNELPTFGITTNGYALDERVLQVLQKYDFSITLSLDGPKPIHDKERPTRSGKGSYDSIVKNIHRLVAAGLNIEFECTYTLNHLNAEIDIVQLMDFFFDEFDCHTLHCPIVAASPNSGEYIPLNVSLALQGDAVEYSIENLARNVPKTLSTAVRFLQSVTTHTPIWHYCPAGKSEITVNADGELFACFMLMQTPAYSFGSVNSCRDVQMQQTPFRIIGIGSGTEKEQVENMINSADKFANIACRCCWAQPLCHGCLGEDFERMGPAIHRSEISGVSEFCDYKRALAERFLRAVARAHRVTGNTGPAVVYA